MQKKKKRAGRQNETYNFDKRGEIQGAVDTHADIMNRGNTAKLLQYPQPRRDLVSVMGTMYVPQQFQDFSLRIRQR
jgi:hypothetical protein